MKKIFSVTEIKQIEALEFKKRNSSFSLMVDAGTNCAKKIANLTKKKLIIVVCGPGNNGGDGFILAEYLRKKKFKIKVFCLKKKYYRGDAFKAFRKLQIKAKNILDFKIQSNSIIIDCLFGTGLSRKISGSLKEIIYKINRSKQKIISIDIPSGVHGDSGKIMGCAVKANMTLVLHAKKTGHTLHPGKQYCGKIVVVDIGISKNSI